MDNDSDDDDMMIEQICELVNTNMDSVILRYPKLWGLSDLPERSADYFDLTLEYSPDEFRGQFHMSRECFADMLNKLGHSVKNERNLEKKLIFSLWMLNTQDSYETVGDHFSYSKSTAHLIFNEILDGILVHFPDYVRWPSANEYPEISQAFKEQTGGYIPGIVGAIDACHLQIKQPKIDANLYVNSDLKYTIVLQGICDHRKIFTDVFVGAPGELTDAAVFKDSKIYQQLEKLIPAEYHLVGDTAYPLIRNLITPFRDTGHLSEAKARFNRLLSSAGETVFHAINILKERFQKLKHIDTSNPEVANKIVCACVTLHNHVRLFEVEEDDEEFADDPISSTACIDTVEPVEEVLDRKNGGYIKRNYLMSLYD